MKPGDIDIIIYFHLGLKFRLSNRYHDGGLTDPTIWHGRIVGEMTETTGINGPVNRETNRITRGQLQFIMVDGELDWVLDKFTEPKQYYDAQITDCDVYGDITVRKRYLTNARRRDGIGVIDIAGPELALDVPLDTFPRRRGYGDVKKMPLEYVENAQLNPTNAPISQFDAVPFCLGPAPSRVYRTEFVSPYLTGMIDGWLAASGRLNMGINIPAPAFTTSAWTGWWDGVEDGGWTRNTLAGQPTPHINASHPPKDLVGRISLPSQAYLDQTVILGTRGLRDNPHPHNDTPSLTVTALGESFRFSAYPENQTQTTVFKEFNSDRETWGTNRLTLSGQHDSVTFALFVGLVPKRPIYANVQCSKIDNAYQNRPITMARQWISELLTNAIDAQSFTDADVVNEVTMGMLIDDASETTHADVIFPLVNSTGWRLVEKYGVFHCVNMAPPSTASREIKTYRDAELTAIKPPQDVYVRQRIAWSGDEEQDYRQTPTTPPKGAVRFDTYASRGAVYNRIAAWKHPSYSVVMSELREPKLFIGDHIRLPVKEQQLLGKPAIITETSYTFGESITSIRARVLL